MIILLLQNADIIGSVYRFLNSQPYDGIKHDADSEQSSHGLLTVINMRSSRSSRVFGHNFVDSWKNEYFNSR